MPSFKSLAYFYRKARGMYSDMLLRRWRRSTTKERFSYAHICQAAALTIQHPPQQHNKCNLVVFCAHVGPFLNSLNFLFIHTQCLTLKSSLCAKIITGFAYMITVIQDINNLTITLPYLLILSWDFPFYFVKASLAVVWTFTWQKSRNERTPSKEKELAAKSLWEHCANKYIH